MQWGGVRARYCPPVHLRVVKNKWKNVCGQTIHVLTSSITHGIMELIASPCSWSLSHQDVNVNYVRPCMLLGHASQEPFHRYGVRRYLVNRVRNYVLHKNKAGEVIFNLPRPLPPKVQDLTASNNSPPPGQKGWTCPSGCPRGGSKSD